MPTREMSTLRFRIWAIRRVNTTNTRALTRYGAEMTRSGGATRILLLAYATNTRTRQDRHGISLLQALESNSNHRTNGWNSTSPSIDKHRGTHDLWPPAAQALTVHSPLSCKNSRTSSVQYMRSVADRVVQLLCKRRMFACCRQPRYRLVWKNGVK